MYIKIEQSTLVRYNLNLFTLSQMMFQIVFWQEIGQTPQVAETSMHNVDFPQDPISVKRFSQPHMPNRKYLNYLLLTNKGELECYDEACYVTDPSKYEVAMNK